MTRWSRAATNAMECLYNASWRWAAIAAHVSAVEGVARTVGACQRRAKDCGMLDRARMRTALTVTQYDDDILDMALLDYSAPQMAIELETQYGRRFHTSWVYKRIRAHGGSSYRYWRARSAERKRKRISEGRQFGIKARSKTV